MHALPSHPGYRPRYPARAPAVARRAAGPPRPGISRTGHVWRVVRSRDKPRAYRGVYARPVAYRRTVEPSPRLVERRDGLRCGRNDGFFVPVRGTRASRRAGGRLSCIERSCPDREFGITHTALLLRRLRTGRVSRVMCRLLRPSPPPHLTSHTCLSFASALAQALAALPPTLMHTVSLSPRP